MAFQFLALLPVVEKVIDKIFPDKEAADKAKLEMFRMQQQGELKQLEADVQLALGQMKVNEAEATAGFFRGGWRPAVGWVCASGLAYQFLIRPLLTFILTLNGTPQELPGLEMDTLLTLLLGMLGLGAYRTAEKVKGLP